MKAEPRAPARAVAEAVREGTGPWQVVAALVRAIEDVVPAEIARRIGRRFARRLVRRRWKRRREEDGLPELGPLADGEGWAPPEEWEREDFGAALERAVGEEDFELAALLRDEMLERFGRSAVPGG